MGVSASREFRSPTQSGGFTLLEAVVAVALFTIAMAEILNLQGRSINDAFTARQYNTVAKLARNKMVELETQVRGKVFTEVQAEQNGSFPDPDQDYRWEAKIKELEFPDLGALMSGGEGGDSGAPAAQNQIGSQIGKSLSTYLTKSLRLVQLTIFWKKGTKEQDFTVSTYWVDLTNELSM